MDRLEQIQSPWSWGKCWGRYDRECHFGEAETESLGLGEKLGNDRKEPLWRGWNRYRVPGGGGLEGKREGGDWKGRA